MAGWPPPAGTKFRGNLSGKASKYWGAVVGPDEANPDTAIVVEFEEGMGRHTLTRAEYETAAAESSALVEQHEADLNAKAKDTAVNAAWLAEFQLLKDGHVPADLSSSMAEFVGQWACENITPHAIMSSATYSFKEDGTYDYQLEEVWQNCTYVDEGRSGDEFKRTAKFGSWLIDGQDLVIQEMKWDLARKLSRMPVGEFRTRYNKRE